ncbi:MAG TPA: MmcQ/YjbR family DNA-binding protein [Thermoanaerobaculia bacterium]|nr:MmcQ/YjbR family DNA-binding protein [Thermoanaerobaculia bacterium]
MNPKGPRKNPPPLEKELRRIAMSYPEVREEFPWGERAFKVAKKVFVFLGSDETDVSMSVKLPESNEMALQFPFSEPTHYGLGKSGWVTVSFAPGDDVPMFLLEGWINESYRAVAPRKLAERAPVPARAAPSAKPKKKPAASRKKPAAR